MHSRFRMSNTQRLFTQSFQRELEQDHENTAVWVRACQLTQGQSPIQHRLYYAMSLIGFRLVDFSPDLKSVPPMSILNIAVHAPRKVAIVAKLRQGLQRTAAGIL